MTNAPHSLPFALHQDLRVQQPVICFLNRSYWPDVEATGQLLTELCESLTDSFEVHVVAGKPNQVADVDQDDWKTVTIRNGVYIHRVDHLQLSKNRLVTRALNYLSFIRATRRTLRTLATPDAVVFETDPFLLAFEAARLQKRTGCRVVGYLQDIYPDVAVALGKVTENWGTRRLRNALFSIYRGAQRMIVLSDDMKNLLTESGVDASRVEVISNWADTNSIQPIVPASNDFRARNGLQGRFVVMYSGNLGLTQRLEEFIDAAAILQDKSSIVFTLVGKGSQRVPLERRVRSLGLTNVRFFDYQPKSQLAHSLSAGDLHFVPLTREISRCLMPSKLYGIMAAGRPILTNAPFGSSLHKTVQEYQIGITVPPGDTQAIARSIQEAANSSERLNEMGTRARHLAVTEYTRNQATERFRLLLQRLCNEQPA